MAEASNHCSLLCVRSDNDRPPPALQAPRGLKWVKMIGENADPRTVDPGAELKPSQTEVARLHEFLAKKLATGGSSAACEQQELSNWGLLSQLRSENYTKVGSGFLKPAEEMLQPLLVFKLLKGSLQMMSSEVDMSKTWKTCRDVRAVFDRCHRLADSRLPLSDGLSSAQVLVSFNNKADCVGFVSEEHHVDEEKKEDPVNFIDLIFKK